jgi:adenosine deaminase
VIANVIDDVGDHPFARQREAGVLVTVNSDDPGMMGTTICDDYEAVTDRFDYDPDTIEDIALDAIEASWAPADEQAALRERFVGEMAALREKHGLSPRAG